MIYGLPSCVELHGREYEVRTDYRAILDICIAMGDPELNGQEKALVALDIFYVDFLSIPAEQYEEALEKCFWFINCGQQEGKRSAPKLVDWEQDFQYIVAPINRVCGKEIRAVEYMHWWTFISYYYEIGDCLFAQIVRIRDLLGCGIIAIWWTLKPSTQTRKRKSSSSLCERVACILLS